MRASSVYTFLAVLAIMAALLVVGVQAQQPTPHVIADCQQFLPYGTPVLAPSVHPAIPVRAYVPICRTAYVTLNDLTAKVPVWTAYTLTQDHAIGCVARSNAFAADQSLPKGQRSDPKDYVGTGFDIGHIAPDGDMSWETGVEHESFILSNMAPQAPHLNRGIWKLLESDVRAWAYERGDTLLVYAGPLYDTNADPKIGTDQVDVPRAFYKIVVDTKTHEVLAFLFPKEGIEGNNLASLQVSEALVEKQVGITLPLPKDAKETALWPVDLGAFTKAKAAKCHGSGEDK